MHESKYSLRENLAAAPSVASLALVFAILRVRGSWLCHHSVFTASIDRKRRRIFRLNPSPCQADKLRTALSCEVLGQEIVETVFGRS